MRSVMVRRTNDQLEISHAPIEQLASKIFLGAVFGGLALFSFADFPNSELPSFVRWGWRIAGGVVVVLFVRSLYVDCRISSISIDVGLKSLTIVRRPWLTSWFYARTSEREVHGTDGIARVVLREWAETTGTGEDRMRTRYRSLQLEKRDGEKISLFDKKSKASAFSGMSIGKETADFLGVKFAVE